MKLPYGYGSNLLSYNTRTKLTTILKNYVPTRAGISIIQKKPKFNPKLDVDYPPIRILKDLFCSPKQLLMLHHNTKIAF
jgi:hypothetical protein